jgi:superfamily II DNA/RNA helicase
LSPTGSGKHLLFITILELLQPEILSVQCLILVPSREWDKLSKFGKKWEPIIKVNVCYGGHSIDTEIKNLSNPPVHRHPGRIADI